MDIGIGLFIMIQVGASMEEFHFGIAGYLIIGERITETIFGEDTHGIIIIYLIVIFNKTGELGIIPTTGISQNIGSLHTIMMEGHMPSMDRRRVMLIKDMVRVALTRGMIGVNSPKAPPHKEI